MVDASALAEYLLRTERGREIVREIESPENDLHAPELCDVEVAAVLRRALLARRVGPRRARAALADHLDLPLARHPHRGILPRILQLRENFSAYDATYVALAEGLRAPLLTADGPLARAVGGHTEVEVLPI